jgi:hypothetical protein
LRRKLGKPPTAPAIARLIRKLKRESKHDIIIGGAELAGLALEADLVVAP